MLVNSFQDREIGLAVPILAAVLAGVAGGTAEAGPGESPPPFPSRTEAQVLVILAHPDDEGVVAPLLARYALDEKRVVVNAYVTSGMYGTDRSRSLKGPAFGLARLTELHWALDRLGVAMFHCLGREDAVEAEGDPAGVLEAWGREETVGELTRLIRLHRPREMITWVPGPPASHVEHMAAGAAALLAARAAASPDRFPGQLQDEGLHPWEVPQVLVVGQAEKLGYERFPSLPGAFAMEAGRIRLEPVDVVSPSRGVRYGDIARQAMKEHRAVSMVNNLGREGSFDDPLRLTRVFEPGVPEPAAGVRLSVRPEGAQAFFESLSGEIGDPRLPRLFPVEVVVRREGEGFVVAQVENGSGERFRGSLSLELPEHWEVSTPSRRLSLQAGAARELRWSFRPPDGDPGGVQPARLTLRRKEEILGLQPLAVRVLMTTSEGGGPQPSR